MKEHIREDIRNNIYYELKDKYNVSNLKELNGYQNFVYEGIIDNKSYILRLSHPSHRNKIELKEEIKFIKILDDYNVPIAKPLKILSNKFIEEIESNEELYFLTVFEKAKGVDWNKKEHTDQNFYNAGKALGKIHKASKNTNIKFKRDSWDDNQYLEIAENVIPDKKIIKNLEEFKEGLGELPTNKDSYGLTHGDYFFGNLIYDNDKITVIDFDECEYNWFIYDIAVYLFYYLLGGDPKNMDIEYNKKLFKKFITGYKQENEIDIFWIEKLPLFFRLREFILLSSIYRSYYPELGNWQKDYIEAAEYRIKNDIPFVDIDYNKQITLFAN